MWSCSEKEKELVEEGSSLASVSVEDLWILDLSLSTWCDRYRWWKYGRVSRRYWWVWPRWSWGVWWVRTLTSSTPWGRSWWSRVRWSWCWTPCSTSAALASYIGAAPPLVCDTTPPEVAVATGAVVLVGCTVYALPPMYPPLVLPEYAGGKA